MLALAPELVGAGARAGQHGAARGADAAAARRGRPRRGAERRARRPARRLGARRAARCSRAAIARPARLRRRRICRPYRSEATPRRGVARDAAALDDLLPHAPRAAALAPARRPGARAASRSSPARRGGSGPRRCGGSPPRAGTWSPSTAASDDPRLPYALGTVAELQALGNERVVAIPADVTDVEALAGAVEVAERRWGGLDVVVAAAGVIAGGAPAWELDAAAGAGGPRDQPRRRAQRRPRRRPRAAAAPAAARGPLHRRRLDRRHARPPPARRLLRLQGRRDRLRPARSPVELGGTGVTANAVSPGSTRTAILDESARLYGLESAEAFAGQQPLERLLEPEEIAAPDRLARRARTSARSDRRRLPARRRPFPLARPPVRKGGTFALAFSSRAPRIGGLPTISGPSIP